MEAELERHEVCQTVLNLTKRMRYLEIGVNAGLTFKNIDAHLKVAVDPKFLFDTKEAVREDQRCEFHEITSDAYFAKAEASLKFNVIYLDGLHTVEQTLRDLLNATHFLSDDGVIVIDDVCPTSYAASLKDMEAANAFKIATGERDTNWMGDVYRLIWFVDAFMQQWTYRTVGDNHGQIVMWRACRPAESISSVELEAVGRLTFQEFVEGPKLIRRESMEEIVRLIRKSREA